ncbi:nSTAND1 domain-containing NTPase [Nonomuraea sp. NPDC003707]
MPRSADVALGPAQVAVIAREGGLVGGGFLFTGADILTCAHVVNRALGRTERERAMPDELLTVEFPLLDGNPRAKARVVRWDPIRDDESGDVGWLRLVDQLPPGAMPVALLSVEELWDHDVHVFGFPAVKPSGAWAQGRLRGREAVGRLQIDDDRWAGYQIQPGFSGSPLWDDRLDGVVGMVVAAAAKRRTSYMIPASTLIDTWPELGELVSRQSPYLGLRPFREQDREFFFGRDELAESLADAVSQHPVTTLYGPSGCGKSSLIGAGILPLIRQRHARTAVVETRVPLEPGPGERLIVVDQAEEFFSENRVDELVRIVHDATEPARRSKLIVAMRADYLEAAMARPQLAALWAQSHLVKPMSRDELRSVIVRPAARKGIRFEDELVNRILDDVGDTATALPLLQFALARLWTERPQGGLVTMAHYAAMGGVENALASYADEVWRAEITSVPAAERLLTRLVEPGETARPVRRRANRCEFSEEDWDLARRLATTRLLTVDDDSVEIVHETLIQNWPGLRDLVEVNRPFLFFRHQLVRDIDQWRRSGVEEDLLHGVTLATARSFLASHGHLLDAEERGFVKRSADAARRRSRFLLALKIGVPLLALAALVASFLFVRQSQQRAVEQTRSASAAMAALSSGLSTTLPDTAKLLAVAAYRTSPTRETYENLFAQYLTTVGVDHLLTRNGQILKDFQLSQDGSRIMTWFGDREVGVWSIGQNKAVYVGLPVQEPVFRVSFSPDGAAVAIVAGTGRVTVYEIDGQGRVGRFSHVAVPGPIDRISLGAAGRVLLASSSRTTGEVWLMDVRSSAVLSSLNLKTSFSPRLTLLTIQLSPDGGRILAAWDPVSFGSKVWLDVWDVRAKRLIHSLEGGPAATGLGLNAAPILSGDAGTVVACRSKGNGPRDLVALDVYDTGTGKPRQEHLGFEACGETAGIDQSGSRLAAINGYKIDLFDLRTGDRSAEVLLPPGPRGHTSGPPLAYVEHDVGRLAVSMPTGVYLRDVMLQVPAKGATGAEAMSPDARYIFTSATLTGPSALLNLADTTTGRNVASVTYKDHFEEDPIFSPDGRYIVARDNHELRVRRVPDLALVAHLPLSTLAPLDKAENWNYLNYAFASEGDLLVCDNGSLSRWHVPTMELVGSRVQFTTPRKDPSYCSIDAAPRSPLAAVRIVANVGEPEVLIWNTTTSRITPLKPSEITGVDPQQIGLDPSGRFLGLMDGDVDGTMALIDVQSGKQVWKQAFPRTDGEGMVRADPAGRMMRFVAPGKIVTVDLNTHRVSVLDPGAILVGDEANGIGLGHVLDLTPNLDTVFHGNLAGELGPLSLDPAVWARHLCQLAGRVDFSPAERSTLPQGADQGVPCDPGRPVPPYPTSS